jgi:hypothetical protein
MIRTVRSHYSVMRSSWVTTMAAMRRDFISERISSITCAPSSVSSADVGSSNKARSGIGQ